MHALLDTPGVQQLLLFLTEEDEELQVGVGVGCGVVGVCVGMRRGGQGPCSSALCAALVYKQGGGVGEGVLVEEWAGEEGTKKAVQVGCGQGLRQGYGE